jgi:hypothetical protein
MNCNAIKHFHYLMKEILIYCEFVTFFCDGRERNLAMRDCTVEKNKTSIPDVD